MRGCAWNRDAKLATHTQHQSRHTYLSMAYEQCPRCGKEKHQLNACRHCGFSRRTESGILRARALPEKAKSVEKPDALKAGKKPTLHVDAGTIKQRSKSKFSGKSTRRRRGREKPEVVGRVQGETVKLLSHRGKTLQGSFPCCSCGRVVNNPTRYSQSNVGPVTLCASCKSRIRRESFPQKEYDALDLAETGGFFEGNRRRH
jgi:hypothetical protein